MFRVGSIKLHRSKVFGTKHLKWRERRMVALRIKTSKLKFTAIPFDNENTNKNDNVRLSKIHKKN